MSNKRLQEEEFDALRPHLEQFKQENVEAIRRVLVDGVQQKDIAMELRVTKVAVSAMVGRAWRLHLEHSARPEGWETVSVLLPRDFARLVKYLAAIVRKAQK